MKKTVSCFSNIGVGEAFLEENGFDVTLACEIDKTRCEIYKQIYKKDNIICGDITKIKEEFCEKAKDAYLFIATPPCQGFSGLNKNKNDPRNLLLFHVIELIKIIKPNYALIENVPRMLTAVLFENKTAATIIKESLEEFNVEIAILNAKNFNTPQNRRRAIVLITRKDEKLWQMPELNEKVITLRDAIGDLPSLESGERKGPLHYAKKHSENHIQWMKHTATGMSALKNENIDHRPHVVENGEKRTINAFLSTYKRMRWDTPAPTLIKNSNNISSSNTVHPGRLQPDGTYSDARTLSILEAMRVMGLPDNWAIPHNLSYRESINFLGEGFCPKLVEALVKNIK